MSEFTIGIDPDLHKSGIAVWNASHAKWDLHKAIPNEDIIDTLSDIAPASKSKIYLEAGWVNKKSNFRGGNYRTAQAKARNVGENHAAGKMLVKMLEKAGYQVFLVRPLSKGNGILKSKQGSWTQHGRKWIQERSGISEKMNDDVRDAVYLVCHFSMCRTRPSNDQRSE